MTVLDVYGPTYSPVYGASSGGGFQPTETLLWTAPAGDPTATPVALRIYSDSSLGAPLASVTWRIVNGRYVATFPSLPAGTYWSQIDFTGIYGNDRSDQPISLPLQDAVIVTLAQVKQQLDKTGTNDDAELQAYVDAVRGPIEDYCGPVLPVQRTVTVTAYGSTLVLPSSWVVGVTSISPDVANVVQPHGVLEGRFAGTYTITYTEGMATVPPEINLAARIIVASWWKTQRGNIGGAVAAGGPEDLVDFPGVDRPIPATAIALMQRWRRTPAVA